MLAVNRNLTLNILLHVTIITWTVTVPICVKVPIWSVIGEIWSIIIERNQDTPWKQEKKLSRKNWLQPQRDKEKTWMVGEYAWGNETLRYRGIETRKIE